MVPLAAGGLERTRPIFVAAFQAMRGNGSSTRIGRGQVEAPAIASAPFGLASEILPSVRPRRRRSRPHHRALDDLAEAHVLPQGHEQLARQRDDRRLLARLGRMVAQPREIPARQRRLRLMARPQPGDFQHRRAQPRIARFRYALLMGDRAAPPRRRRIAGVSPDLPPIGKVPRQPFRP